MRRRPTPRKSLDMKPRKPRPPARARPLPPPVPETAPRPTVNPRIEDAREEEAAAEDAIRKMLEAAYT